MPTTPLGAAVAAVREALVPSSTSCTVHRSGPPTWIPGSAAEGTSPAVHTPSVQIEDFAGALPASCRTTGDLGRHVAAVFDHAARLIADQVAARVSVSAVKGAGHDPLRARLVDLARQAVEMAHADRKSAEFFRRAERVALAVLAIEPHLEREPRT